MFCRLTDSYCFCGSDVDTQCELTLTKYHINLGLRSRMCKCDLQ